MKSAIRGFNAQFLYVDDLGIDPEFLDPISIKSKKSRLMNEVPETTTQETVFISLMNQMAQSAHANSRNKGFWSLIDELKSHPRFSEIETFWKISRVGLMHSEASEAIEGIRKDLKDDHLPHRSMEVAELADVVIRVLDHCGAYNLPLGETIVEKMRYNTSREFMHGKKA